MATLASNPDLWTRAAERLKGKDQTTLKVLQSSSSSVHPQDLLHIVEEEKRKCEHRQLALKRRRGKDSIILRDVFAKIAVWVQKFVKVGDIAIQYDPGHAALPWAGAEILKAAIQDIEQFAAATQGIEQTCRLLVHSKIMEELYLSYEPRSPAMGFLEDALVDLYTAILGYILRAYKYYGNSTLQRMARSNIMFLDDFKQNSERLSSCESEVRRCGHIVELERQKETQADTKAMSNRDSMTRQQLRAALQEMSDPIKRAERSLGNISDKLNEDQRLEILQWISPIPYQKHQKEHFRQALEGTGVWFLEDDRLKAWLDSSQSTLLWLRGNPGVGKTTLVSILVQRLLEESKENNSAPPNFFFCARNVNEPERSSADCVLRSLARQSSFSRTTKFLLPPAVHVYNEQRLDGFSAGDLAIDECLNLMIKLTDHRPVTTIIIDGLDECDVGSRDQLLANLARLVEKSSSLIKILIASRFDRTISSYLRNVPNILIEARDNADDIGRFIDISVDTFIDRQGRLGKNIDRGLPQKIKDVLIERSEGMFRWVEQSLEYLKSLTLMDLTEDRLGKLPAGLHRLYASSFELLQELRHPREFKMVQEVLRLIMSLQRPLETDDFLRLLSFSCEEWSPINVEDLLDLSMNFVTHDLELNTFRLSHLSVQEFLETKEDFTKEKCNESAAVACLRMMLTPTPVERLHSNEVRWITDASAHGDYDDICSLCRYATFWCFSHVTIAEPPYRHKSLEALLFQVVFDRRSLVLFDEMVLVTSNCGCHVRLWRTLSFDNFFKGLPLDSSRFWPVWGLPPRYDRKASSPVLKEIEARDPIYFAICLDLASLVKHRLDSDSQSSKARYWYGISGCSFSGRLCRHHIPVDVGSLDTEGSGDLMHLAVGQRSWKSMKVLIDYGAPVEESTLILVAKREDLEPLELILKGARNLGSRQYSAAFQIIEHQGWTEGLELMRGYDLQKLHRPTKCVSTSREDKSPVSRKGVKSKSVTLQPSDLPSTTEDIEGRRTYSALDKSPLSRPINIDEAVTVQALEPSFSPQNDTSSNPLISWWYRLLDTTQVWREHEVISSPGPFELSAEPVPLQFLESSVDFLDATEPNQPLRLFELQAEPVPPRFSESRATSLDAPEPNQPCSGFATSALQIIYNAILFQPLLV